MIGKHDEWRMEMTKRKQTKTPHPTDYAPYHTLPAFDAGIDAYMANVLRNPFEGYEAQAFDRGAEYAMRVTNRNGGR